MERLGGVFEWCTEKAQRGPTRGTGVSEAGGQNPRLLGAPQSTVKEAHNGWLMTLSGPNKELSGPVTKRSEEKQNFLIPFFFFFE